MCASCVFPWRGTWWPGHKLIRGCLCCCCCHARAVSQGYLNYQVIHHLFPTMPQSYGPQVSRELRIKAKEWGIAYTTVGCLSYSLGSTE